MKSKILRKMFALVVGVSLALVSFGANAMPAGSVASSPSNIQLTAGGCGPGFAPGPRGFCRPMRVARPVVVVPARPVVVVPARPVVRVAPLVRAGPCGVRVGPVAIRGC